MANREKDLEIINIKCDNCGKDISIKYGTYRKTKNKHHYCRTCRGKFEHDRINALPEKERSEYLNKKNASISNGWAKQTLERKQEISQNRIAAWNNNSRRKLDHIKRLIERWNNMTLEERTEQLNKMSTGKEEYWSKIQEMQYLVGD